MRFRIVTSLVAGCLIPVETTWSFPAFAQGFAQSAQAAEQQAPASAPPPVSPAHPKTVKVHMVTNETNVQFLFREAPGTPSTPGDAAGLTRQYSAGCLAPCDLELAPGDYYVALTRSGGKAYEGTTSFKLQTPTTLVGSYQSHSGTRVAGIVLLSSLLPIGAVIVLTGALADQSCAASGGGCGSADREVIAIGVATMLVGGLLGIALVGRSDETAVQVIPQAAPKLVIPGTRTEHSSDSTGLALRFAF